TSTGLGMGTAEYTAPEQAKGFADSRSDLYSLGIVLFEMLTGRVPFVGRTAFDVLFQHATAPIQPILRVNPALPQPLVGMDRVIQRALAKDPARRFQSASELNAAVQAVLAQYIESSSRVVVSPEAPVHPSPDEAASASNDNGSTPSTDQHMPEQWSPP